MDSQKPDATCLAVADGKFLAVGNDEDVVEYEDASTKVIDAKGHRLIPGHSSLAFEHATKAR